MSTREPHSILLALGLALCALTTPGAAGAQSLPGMGDAPPPAGGLWVRPLAEKRVDALPDGALHWRIESFATLAEAREGLGPHALAVEAEGRAWRFTLVGDGASPAPEGTIVVGPVQRPAATHFLLRINHASGAPGDVTPVHSHPGSEAFYVLRGVHGVQTAHGMLRVAAGRAEPGHGADMAMRVSSLGPGELGSLVMFVVDADRPFSSPAVLD